MPLFGFLFGTPLALLATVAAAASIPIIIHLLNRRRFRVVTWAAMRFLLAAQRKNARKVRLEQLLLLAVRVLIVLLLVLAMASVMPWTEPLWRALFPSSTAHAATASERTHKILVLDGSFSMAARVGDSTCFERARRKASEILDNAQPGDGFSVVLMASPPELIVLEPSGDAEEVRTQLDAEHLYLPHGDASLADTLTAIESILTDSPAKFTRHEIYFLTDLQRATWIPETEPGAGVDSVLTGQFKRICDKARLVLVDVGRDGLNNAAIADLQPGSRLVTPNVRVPLIATLRYHGSGSRNVGVEIWAGKAGSTDDHPFQLRRIASGKDGQQDAQFQLVAAPKDRWDPEPDGAIPEANDPEAPPNPQTVGFALPLDGKAGALTATATFWIRFKQPGDYVVQVRLVPEAGSPKPNEPVDPLDLDNVRSVVVQVKTPRVLIVNGYPGADPFKEGVGDLKYVLNPYPDGDPRAQHFARRVVVDVPTFLDPDKCDLTDYDCIILHDVPSLEEPPVQRLEAQLRRGAAVIFCLGPRVDPESYNSHLYETRRGEGLLPCRLEPDNDPAFPRKPIRQALREPTKKPAFALHADLDSYKRPPLAAFEEGTYRADLMKARFRNYALVDQLRPRARTVLSFLPDPDNEETRNLPARAEPAVIEWKRYRGRVIVLTSTISREWSDWAPQHTYGEFINELVEFGIEGRLRRPEALVGQTLQEILGPADAEQEADITVLHPSLPDDKVTPAPRVSALDPELGGCVLRIADTSTSGIYRVALGPEGREHLFAVNVPHGTKAQPGSESDLARTSKEQLQDTYAGLRDAGAEFEVVSGEPGQQTTPVSPITVAGRVARYLLLIMFGLVLLEVVLAWLFGHYSSETATIQGPPIRRRFLLRILPGAIAGLAVCGVLVLGCVLVNYVLTGTFLGFLPGSVRSTVMGWLGEPVAERGEGIHERLEFTPYLMGSPLIQGILIALLALAALGLVVTVYLREGTQRVSPWYKLMLAGLRGSFVLLTLLVLLPQLKLWFERQGLPVVAIILDNSESMGESDQYPEPENRDAVARLVRDRRDKAKNDEEAGKEPSRLHLAEAVLDREQPDWLLQLLDEHKVRAHVYCLDDWLFFKAGQKVPDPKEIEGLVRSMQGFKDLNGNPHDYEERFRGFLQRLQRAKEEGTPREAIADPRQMGDALRALRDLTIELADLDIRLSERVAALEQQRERSAAAKKKPGRPAEEGNELKQAEDLAEWKNYVRKSVSEARAILDSWLEVKSRLEVTNAEEAQEAIRVVRGLPADRKSSPLGNRVSQVRSRYRGSALAAVIMLTDGITTRDKKRLSEAAVEGVRRDREGADARRKVPLFFVGIGSKHESRPDVYLDELKAPSDVHANDQLIIEAKVVAQGYRNLPVDVTLYERDPLTGDLKPLKTQTVVTGPEGKQIQFQLRPEKPPGNQTYEEKLYVIKVPKQEQPRPEIDPDNNQLDFSVVIYKSEKRPIGVLYVEGYPRYEWRYLKHLLERELPDEQGNKSVDLRVLLLDADSRERNAASGNWFETDKSAAPLLGNFPTRDELLAADGYYDVVILGDIDPENPVLGKTRVEREKNLGNLADFVKAGGGLLFIAGSRNSPQSFKDTALRDLLPVTIDPNAARTQYVAPEGFWPQVTHEGKEYPFLRVPTGDAKGAWEASARLYWWSEGWKVKPGAKVLLETPRPGARDDKQPLMIHQFVKDGRVLFFGVDETWRWRFRENEGKYNDFWRQTIRYLWRRQPSYPRIQLKRERVGREPPLPGEPYRPGDVVKVRVHFPVNARPRNPEAAVTLHVKRRLRGADDRVETEDRTLSLTRKEGEGREDDIYEGALTGTQEGEYYFELETAELKTEVAPHAFCRVIPVRNVELDRRLEDGSDEGQGESLRDEGEKARLGINEEDMRRAAEETQGGYFNLTNADDLLGRLPEGKRVRLDTPGPPWLLWNHALVFLIALGLLASEWILRKRKHLL